MLKNKIQIESIKTIQLIFSKFQEFRQVCQNLTVKQVNVDT